MGQAPWTGAGRRVGYRHRLRVALERGIVLGHVPDVVGVLHRLVWILLRQLAARALPVFEIISVGHHAEMTNFVNDGALDM